jgi:hypothetical protein
MVELIRRSLAILFAGIVGVAGTANAQPSPSGDPPARVGRLAFVQGTVSFHDRDQTDWAPAVTNTPLTSGDALWTEPNARSELSIAGTRVRMDSGTQLDMLAIDDTQTRMQLDQGRIDVKTFTYDTHQPYEILTPRGTITLQQQGDYSVEAGSTQDPTRLGVRSGAAQIQAPGGQVLAVRAGEVGEIAGDGDMPQLHTIKTAPPPMPAYWAERDRVVVYDQPPQYVTAGMTGYEDLNYYGSWSNDPEYGQVWAPRALVAGWEPYRTGRWSYVQPWGWTWVDEQPWGFAPYHYGRWANRNNRWVWVPPQRDLRPVYAPALVAFVGGVELGVAIGQQSRAPVGWFPLGPREVYVPPYSNDRDYYRRVNQGARVQEQVMEDHWQRAQRREAIAANQQQTAFMNRRFATVVPAEDFARSRPVARVALQVAPDRIAAAPVAPVAAPPAPTQSIRAVQAPGTAPGTAPATAPTGRPNDPTARPQGQGQGQATANVQAPAAQVPAAQVNVPTTETRLSNMQAIGRPQPATGDRPRAPGPQIATTRTNEPSAAPNANAPNANTPNAAAPNAARPGLPPLAPRTGAPPPQLQGERSPASGQPGQPAQPGTPPKPADKAVAAPPTGGQPPAGQPGQPPRPPGQANLPPVQAPNANRPVEPPKPGEPPKPQQAQQPAAPVQPAPQAPNQAAPPKPQGAVTPPAPQHQAEPPKPQQAQQPVAPPPPQPQAEPPKPQGAIAPPPQPQRQAAPQPQPQAPAPPPPAQAHAPTPPPQPQHQAAPPPPAQAQAPAPAPQPQPQAHPAPPQQAQAPAPAPQQKPAPAPAPQKKDDEKK